MQPRHVIWVGLAPVAAPGAAGRQAEDAAATANLLLSRIGHCLREIGGIELIEMRAASPYAGAYAVPDVYLQCFARQGAAGPDLAFRAVRRSDKAVVWSHACTVLDADDAALVSDMSERILAQLSVNPRFFSAERHLAAVRALEGVERMFSLAADNLADADRCFREAASLYEASSFHAYRAYLSAFGVDDQGGVEPRGGARARAR